MKRVTKGAWYAHLTLQREYKIGIAKNAVQRHRKVNNAIDGKIELLRQRKVPFARKVEQRLHNMFSDSRFKIRSRKKGGGDTEWFYMTGLEYATLELWLFWYAYRYYFIIPFWTLLALILLIISTL